MIKSSVTPDTAAILFAPAKKENRINIINKMITNRNIINCEKPKVKLIVRCFNSLPCHG